MIAPLDELQHARGFSKPDKIKDEQGLGTEFPSHVFLRFVMLHLDLYIYIFVTDRSRGTAKTTTDFHLVAGLNLFYNVFTYLILGRGDHVLEQTQPKEQH